MDNIEGITESELRKDLGITLIMWIRTVNEKKRNNHNGSDTSIKNGRSGTNGYGDLLSLKVSNTQTIRD